VNAQRIRELILQANQIRVEHDEQNRNILQKLEKESRRESESFDAIDDIHQAALVEFDLDKEACDLLNLLYAGIRTIYVAVLNILRHRRRTAAPWESAAR
jgi:hypothetical protein